MNHLPLKLNAWGVGSEQAQRRRNRRTLVLYPMIHFVTANLIYKLSILFVCGIIFDKIVWREEKKKKMEECEKNYSQSHDTTSYCQFIYKHDSSTLNSC